MNFQKGNVSFLNVTNISKRKEDVHERMAEWRGMELYIIVLSLFFFDEFLISDLYSFDEYIISAYDENFV